MASSIECTRCFMKKFIMSSIILLIFAAVIFFIGWVQLAIPAGSSAVLISKTGGIHPQTLEAGSFIWRWERLLPTNTEMRSFSIYPLEVKSEIQGSLPSSDIYREFLEGRPDFSYAFTIRSQIKLRDSALPQFVRRTNALGQDELNQFLEKEAKKINQRAVSLLLQKTEASADFIAFIDTETLIKKLSEENSEIEILSLEIESQKTPDTELYLLAKEAYFHYQEAVRKSLIDIAETEASKSAEDFLQIERFAKWGKVLQDYPILIDFIAVSRDDAASALEALKKMR